MTRYFAPSHPSYVILTLEEQCDGCDFDGSVRTKDGPYYEGCELGICELGCFSYQSNVYGRPPKGRRYWEAEK